MENQVHELKPKPKKDASTIRVSNATQKLLSSVLQKVNKKAFGRRVKADPLLQLALSKLTDADFKMLQEQSLSNADRMEMKYRDFVRTNGPISKDEFLGILLVGENTKSPSQNRAVSEGKSAT